MDVTHRSECGLFVVVNQPVVGKRRQTSVRLAQVPTRAVVTVLFGLGVPAEVAQAILRPGERRNDTGALSDVKIQGGRQRCDEKAGAVC